MQLPILIFANPISGRGRGGVLATRLRDHLRDIGYAPQVLLDPPASVPSSRIPSDAAAAIVIGGDGTLRAVARRLFGDHSPPESAAPNPPILLVPTGTANLMAQHLGIRWPAAHAEARIAHTLQHHDRVILDAATANGELFLLMAGVGIDAQVVHELERHRTGPITKAHYLWPLASTFATYPFPPLRVTVDGRLLHEMAPASAFVGNVPEYGLGFPMVPHARADDGLLDVCVVPCRSRNEAVSRLLAAAAGEHLGAPGVLYARGRHVRIDSPRKVPVQVDGEATGHTPVEIRLLPARIPFIVPVGE